MTTAPSTASPTASPTRPRAHPLWGSLPAYRRDPLRFGRELRAACGDVAETRFFNKRVFFVTDPELVHQVLVRDAGKFRKSPAYALLEPTLGKGLLTSDGEHWRRQRRLVQPAFHHGRVQRYAEVMVAYGEEAAREWREDAPIAINREMMRLTLRVVAKTLFGADISAQAGRVKEALEILLHAVTEALGAPIPLPAWLPTPRNRRAKRATRELDAIVREIVEARRQSGADTGDLLSMLLLSRDERGEGMGDKEVRDEAVTLILAGHETTANALTWTFYLLAQHPEAREKLERELDQALAGRSPSAADLAALGYAEMVVKESMRLFPPAPEIGRQAAEALVLGSTRVPAGAIVVIPIHALHRDPRFFADPERFVPERFGPEAPAPPKFAYLPFGGGPRICIGNAFAQMEATLLLATLAQRWRLELLPGQTVVPEATLTLRPKADVLMRAVPR